MDTKGTSTTLKIALIGAVAALAIVVASSASKRHDGFSWRDAPQPVRGEAVDPLTAIYRIDGTPVPMLNGASDADPDAGGMTTRIFSIAAHGDIDGDNREDAVAIIERSIPGGSILYYVAAAIRRGDKFEGTDAVLVGDRIAPNNASIEKEGIILFNYATQLPWEPLTSRPSVGKTKRLQFRDGALLEIAGSVLRPEVAEGLARKAWGDCGAKSECTDFSVETLDGTDGVWYVQATYDGLMDDSIKAERKISMAHDTGDGWTLGPWLIILWQCREGRGQQDFSVEHCI